MAVNAPMTRGQRISAFFYRHPWAKPALLMLPAVVWLVVVYLGSVGAMLRQSFWSLQEFTGALDKTFTLSTYEQLFDGANRDIIVRTVGLAATVTVLCAVLAFPLAYYMARFATPRMKTILYLAVLMPLWSSYLVRALSWRQILANEGMLLWLLRKLGIEGVVDVILQAPFLGGTSLISSRFSLVIVFTYLWLPFMVLPLETALERVPKSFVEASSDLGARPRLTFRRVIVPLAIPGLIAGSIFTFSLTMGDFILPNMFGSSELIVGQQVYVQQGVVGNDPLAAAFTFVAMVVMLVYLLLAKRAGAFEAL